MKTSTTYESTTTVEPTCYHCGDRCVDTSVHIQERHFCCHGCKMIYTILQDNGLDNFYQLNEHAGPSQRGIDSDSYAYLDDPDTVARLIKYADADKSIVRFYLPQIHCSSCLWLLERLPQLDSHILSARVNFLNKTLQITYSQEISLREVAQLLSMIGYGPHIVLEDLHRDHKPIVDRSIYYKLGVAGFVFGNVMLLSFPEYLGLDATGESGLYHILPYLNILLTIPLLVYSGVDYFKSAWLGLTQRQLSIDVPVSLGLLALFGRSIYEILMDIGPGYLDSLAGLIFFLLIGRWFQHYTYARISFDRDYKSYFPIASNVVRDGKEVAVSLDKIDIGDIIVLRSGDMIPTDAVLLEGMAYVDYSFVTGESTPVPASKGDQLYAGGKQEGGMIKVMTTSRVQHSYLTELWNDHLFDKANDQGRASQLADRVAVFFTTVILIVAFGALAYWLTIDMSTAINAFTSVLIVACPCAVALSIPFAFGNILRLLARYGVYFKNVETIEALSRIDHIIFDKTGTLTYADQEHHLAMDKVSTMQRKQIYALASQSNHPLSRQLSAALRPDLEASLPPVVDFEEHLGHGISAWVGSAYIRIGSASYIGVHADKSTGVWIEIQGQVVGHYQLQQRWREGLPTIINDLSDQYCLSMITGDQSGAKVALEGFFGTSSTLLFEQSPQDKLSYVRDIQRSGQRVMMIGDGLNDAGALKQSNVGLVITEQTANFTPACDMIIDAKHFDKLPALIGLSKHAIRVVYLLYAIALIYNIVGLSIAVQGLLSPVIAAILMPLSSITIVVVGVVLTTYLSSRLLSDNEVDSSSTMNRQKSVGQPSYSIN